MDNGDGGIFLEIVEFVPNGGFLETGRLVRQNIFRYIFQKFTEDVVKCHAVPKDDGYVDYAEALKDYEGFSVLCDSSNITFKTLGIMLFMFILL